MTCSFLSIMWRAKREGGAAKWLVWAFVLSYDVWLSINNVKSKERGRGSQVTGMGFWALLWCVAFHRWHLEQREMISFGMEMFITIILIYLFIYIFLLMCIIPHPWLKGIIFIIGNQCIDSLTNLQLFDHNYFTRIYLYLQIHQINSPLHVSLDQQMRYCS